jgi:hypothetical protein
VFMNHASCLCTLYENMCVYEPYTFDELVTKICVFMNQIMFSELVAGIPVFI